MRRIALLLALTAAACGDAVSPPDPSGEPADDFVVGPPTPSTPDTAQALRPRALAQDAPTPFDRAAMVFDTLEPQTPRVEIQPRPAPTPRPEPPPSPRLEPRPPPPAQAPGSCDVRATESFCFAYTGPGWSAREARGHCDHAPESGYRVAACPEDGAIATCRFVRDDAPTREIVYTYYAPYALSLAELACPGDFERIDDD